MVEASRASARAFAFRPGRTSEDRSLVREALETQAARLFVERATAAEKRELRQMGRRVDQLYAAFEKSAEDREFLFSVNTYQHEAASAHRGMRPLPGLAQCHRKETGFDLQLALRHRRAAAFAGLKLSCAPDRHSGSTFAG